MKTVKQETTPNETLDTKPDETPDTKQGESAVFNSAGLRPLGAGVWIYNHGGGMPKGAHGATRRAGEGETALSPDKAEAGVKGSETVTPDDFWVRAKHMYGLKDGDCVIFVAGKRAILTVV